MIELFGHYIKYIYTDIDADHDKSYLIFINNLNNFWAYSAVGDCCSYSWFESINNPENLMDARVIGIEEKEEYYEEESFKEGVDEVIKIYGYTLKTHKGYTDIEFRNSSNGYYGGSCEYIPDAKLVFPEVEDTYQPNNFTHANFNALIKENKLVSKTQLLIQRIPLLLEHNGRTIKISPLKEKE